MPDLGNPVAREWCDCAHLPEDAECIHPDPCRKGTPALRDALRGTLKDLDYNRPLLTIRRLWPRRYEGWHEREIIRRAVVTVRELRV
jgi:hypothetical protein